MKGVGQCRVAGLGLRDLEVLSLEGVRFWCLGFLGLRRVLSSGWRCRVLVLGVPGLIGLEGFGVRV